MAKDIEYSLKTILRTHSNSEQISGEFEKTLVNRCRFLLYNFGKVVNVDRYLHLNGVVKTAIFLISVLGGAIGFITTYYGQDWPITALTLIWVIYTGVAVLVFIIVRWSPKFGQVAKRESRS